MRFGKVVDRDWMHSFMVWSGTVQTMKPPGTVDRGAIAIGGVRLAEGQEHEHR